MTTTKISAPNSTATDSPPFVRHHRTARALVRTFQEALEPQFCSKGILTQEEFARAVALMMEHWPKALPLFAHTCKACLGTTAPHGEETRPQLFRPDGRRRDFVTRLMFSTLIGRVPETVDPVTGVAFPQVIAPGLQANLLALFYDKEWEALNADAVAIYNQIGTDQDDEVWRRIARQDTLAVLADTMFVRVLLRFKQFHFQRQSFIRRMTDILRDKRFDFADDHFDTMFETMFGRLRGALATELDRARVDIHYGEGTADNMLRIFDQFDKRRLEQSAPIQTLGGGRRPARPMLAQRSMIGSGKHNR